MAKKGTKFTRKTSSDGVAEAKLGIFKKKRERRF